MSYQPNISTATPYTALIAAARFHMRAAKGTYVGNNNSSDNTYAIDQFWSDQELFSIALRGTTDLWGAIIDLHESHYRVTINDGSVVLNANANTITGVPPDLFRVYLMEPVDPTTNDCAFVPRPYNHIEFINARQETVDVSFLPTTGVNIFYDLSGVGTPNSTPVINTAPKLSAAVQIALTYIPILGVQSYVLQSAYNPIPGESDHAIIAWIVAYALGKAQPGRQPDPGWLSVYQTEKSNLMTRMRPRQEQEAIYADGVMDSYWR